MARFIAFFMIAVLVSSVAACGKRGALRLPQQSLTDAPFNVSAAKSLSDGSL